jgi:hypothetical protein
MASPNASHKRIWNIIETADLKALNGDKCIPMVSLNLNEDTTTLLFESENGEDYTYEFDNNCNVKTNDNAITLTDLDGEDVTIFCFDYTPVYF